MPDIFIVDSGSTDGTLDLAREFFSNVVTIDSYEFNHGGTRQMMVDRNPNYDIYIFLTQDAYLCDEEALVNLIAPFSDPGVGAVCGRQLPHQGASIMAQHARFFNYPEENRQKTMDDAKDLGIKTAFMSNSFSAYRKLSLAQVGGFPRDVIFGEDMYVAAKLLMAGWKIFYAGNARVYHSHSYTVREEFARYFDMGVFHAREPWIRQTFGGAGGEGVRFVRSELNFLGVRHYKLWSSSLMRNLCKFIGFKLGLMEANLSLRIKRLFGMNKRYWDETRLT
jgi:rhamnosyltransferase